MTLGLHTIFTLTLLAFANSFRKKLGIVTDYKPAGYLYYIGENMTVHCYLNQPVANTSRFDWGNDIMPRDYITVVNETYLRLDKEVSAADPRKLDLYCFDHKAQTVGKRQIVTEYRPQAVKDLRYQFHGLWGFNATWRLGVPYNLGLTTITAEYTENSVNGSWNKCELLKDGTGCTAKDLKEWTLLSLRVTVTNVKRNEAVFTLFDRLALNSHEKMTSVTTDKPLHYVGDTMSVHCHLKQPGARAARFQYDGNDMPSENITVVNDTYLRLDKEVTPEDPSEAPCLCLDGDMNAVGAAYVVTEYRPQNVSDLVYEYYDQNEFRASWSLGVTYKTQPEIIFQSNSTASTFVTAEYSADSVKRSWRTCELRKDATGCTAEGLAAWEWLSLRVTVTNVWRNDTAVALFDSLSLDKHVKPAPVEIQKTRVLNSTCAQLVWRSSKHYPSFNITWNNTSVITSNENIVLCKFRPFNTYTVSVQAVTREGVHGTKESTTIIMPPAAPSMAPRLTGGGYYRQPCSVKANQSAPVHIYFKPVPPEARNGAELNYTAQLSTQGPNKTAKIHLKGPESNTLVVDVPCGEGFSITMYASNEAGDSPSTTLTIPAVKEVAELYDEVKNLDLLVQEISKENSKKIASWNSSMTMPTKLRFFYCDAKTCRSEACTHWTTLETFDIEAGSQNLTFDSGKADRFGFAAATSNDSWTEIIFTKCIYSKDFSQWPSLQVPETPRVISSEEHINLGLSHVRCKTDNRVLTHYLIVEWCSLSICRYDNVDVPYNSSSTTYTLKDAELHTEYSISMMAVTSHGNTSYSKPVKVTVKPSPKTGLDEREIWGISSTAVILVLILWFLLLFFCRSKLRTARMKFPKTMLLPIPHATWKDPDTTNYKAQTPVAQKHFGSTRRLLGDGGKEENKKKQDDLESGYSGSEVKSHTSYLDMYKSDFQSENRPHDYTMMVESSEQQHPHSMYVGKQSHTACVSREQFPSTPSHTAAKSPGFSQLTSLKEALDISDHNESDQGNEEMEHDGETCSANQWISSCPFSLEQFNKPMNITITATPQSSYVLYNPVLKSWESSVKPSLRYSAGEISGEAQQCLVLDGIEMSTTCSQQQNNKISDPPCKEDPMYTSMKPACQTPMGSYTEESSSQVSNGQEKPTEMKIHENLFHYVSVEKVFEINPKAARAGDLW